MRMSRDEFDKFRRLVLEDVSLQEALRDLNDWREFIDVVIEMGAARGFQFRSDDVEDEIRASRRQWIERTI